MDRRPNEFSKRMKCHLFAAALFFSSALSVTATSPLTMTVSPTQSFAPTTLTVRFHVEPDAANRELEVVADSGTYYRSSRLQLEGTDGPRTTSLELRNLPGGHYEVRGALIDSAGRPRAAVRTQINVLE